MTKLSEIARKVAIDAKATGFDLGDLYDDNWNLTDAEWDQVCDEAEALIPSVRVPQTVRAAWAQVERDFRAEQQAEQRAFCGDR